jgi:monofunctional biosynthetic peptidoglycan transglycosylase
LRAVGASAVLTVVLPVAQCLLLNVVDPWFTLTMLTRCGEHFRAEGELAWPSYDPIDLDDLPRHIPQAALTAEDQKFFVHSGFDREAIEAAWIAYQDHREGQTLRGGSTISQQVARNVFLWQGRNWVRKGLEAWYTIWLELLVPKKRILELYLNVAEMGPMTFGIEAAAQHWYDRDAGRLTAPQAAAIVALLPAPRTRTPGSSYVQKRARWMIAHPAEMPDGVGR